MLSRLMRLGWQGEDRARQWLEARGFSFVTSNFRTRYGEIDLVMRHMGVTVFVEVKTRRSRRFGSPEESISEKKLERLQAATEAYIAKHPSTRDVRLDLIVIERRNGAWEIRHLPGIG